MAEHRAGTREEFDAARAELLLREKELTRLGDELAQQRRALPRVRMTEEYRFQTADGDRTLVELFEGRSQLAVYHFMFGPDYRAGCPTCSSVADSFNALLPHLNARGVTMICVSSAPVDALIGYRERMGWSFNWATTAGNDFNLDLGFASTVAQTRAWAEDILDQLPPVAARNARESGTDLISYITESWGFSSFVLEDGVVYQTYATGGRGVEFLMSYYAILDRMASGRDEGPEFQVWIRRHDEYEVAHAPS